jgi:chromosome segregation ATPase
LSAANKAAIDQALPRLETLSASIDANRVAIEKSAPQLGELKTRVEAAVTAATDAKTAATGVAGLLEQVSGLRAELARQQQTHKEELAARDKQINELQVGLRNSQTTLGGISERLKKLPPKF